MLIPQRFVCTLAVFGYARKTAAGRAEVSAHISRVFRKPFRKVRSKPYRVSEQLRMGATEFGARPKYVPGWIPTNRNTCKKTSENVHV